MKASIIVAVYKDVEALSLIVGALRQQTSPDFELVVAEDAQGPEMARYVSSIEGMTVRHTVQADLGIRKARSINNAILASRGEYLIFIDGDCIPQSRFVEGHLSLAEEGKVLVGRRVNLGPRMSARLRSGELSSATFERSYLRYLPAMLRDGGSHLEQGIPIRTGSRAYRWLVEGRRTNLQMLGCNYSCYRRDMLAINGYDESYNGTAVADDTDLQWRFEARGLSMKSCKNVANVFHLHHDRQHREVDSRAEVALMHRRRTEGAYFCEQGLDQH